MQPFTAEHLMHLEPVLGSDEGNVHDPHRPLIATGAQVEQPHQIPAHQHHRGQLLFSAAGNMLINTPKQQWLVTPQYAVWIAPQDRHLVSAPFGVAYRSVFVEPQCLPARFSYSHPLFIGRELRIAMDVLIQAGEGGRRSATESRLWNWVLAQLAQLPTSSFSIPLPRQARLRNLIEQQIWQPDVSQGVAEIADQLGVSERSVLRFFQQETGMGFQQWRQQMLVTLALQRIQAGQSLTQVALDLGYRSPAAFSTMFRRVTGCAPSQFSM